MEFALDLQAESLQWNRQSQEHSQICVTHPRKLQMHIRENNVKAFGSVDKKIEHASVGDGEHVLDSTKIFLY